MNVSINIFWIWRIRTNHH